MTFTSQAAIFTPFTQEISGVHDISLTSFPSTPFVEPLSQSVPPISLRTPPVSSVQETQRSVNLFPPVYTTDKFSSGGQSTAIIPRIFTTKSQYQLTTLGSFCGNLAAFFPSPVATYSHVPQNYKAQITDAFAKIN